MPRAPIWPSTFEVLAREIFGADRGHRAGAHVGDAAGVEDRLRRAGARIEQRKHRELRREAELVVVDEIADDLDAGGIDGG